MTDQSTEGGRAQLRKRRIMLASAVGIAAKATTIITALVTTPITYGYLGSERFGLWMTVTALVAFLTFADLGLGNGLMSSIATAHGKNDRRQIKILVSSAYAMLTTVSVTILVALWVIYPYINWATLFNVSTPTAVAEAGPAAAMFIVVFAINVPLMIIQRVQLGLQEAFVFGLWQCVASLIALGAVIAAVSVKASLPILILGMTAAPLLTNIINSLIAFSGRLRDIRPSLDCVSTHTSASVMRLGSAFLVLQGIGVINSVADKFIIAQVLSAEAVAPFSVIERLFNVTSSILSVFLVSLWPALSEAAASGDIKWVNKMFGKALKISLAFSVPASIAMLFFAPYVLPIWVPSMPEPGYFMLAGFAVWKIVESITGVAITYMNALKVLKLQIVMMSCALIVTSGLKILLVQHHGAAGSAWGMSIGMVVTVVLPFFLLRDRISYKA